MIENCNYIHITVIGCYFVFLPGPTLKDLDLITLSDWYGVGLQLELKYQDLDIIERDCSDDSRRCQRKMFKLWLRTSPNPTYAQVAIALDQSREETLAHQIRKKYGESNCQN